MNYEYFYGSQAESYSFIRVPRLLMKGKEFRELSTDAKLLYSLLLDRMSLSVRNGWLDEAGRVYIYYTVEEIQNDLNCGHGKACKLLAELDTVKGIGLIERKKQGQGKPTKIFVKQFAESEGHERKPENYTPEKGKSAKRKTGVQASGKAEGNYTDPNYTENSYTDPSIYPSPETNIVGGMSPTPKVQTFFKHVAYVRDSQGVTTTHRKNIRAYRLTALNHAPLTIGPYYPAAGLPP